MIRVGLGAGDFHAMATGSPVDLFTGSPHEQKLSYNGRVTAWCTQRSGFHPQLCHTLTQN